MCPPEHVNEGESPPGTRRSLASLSNDPAYCDTLSTASGVGESSTCGDQHFFVIVALRRPPPHQDLVRAGTARNRLAREDKEPRPPRKGQLPGKRPRETAET
jgi:hypothetical protein